MTEIRFPKKEHKEIREQLKGCCADLKIICYLYPEGLEKDKRENKKNVVERYYYEKANNV